MAHKLRVEYPGAIYHVLNRGDRREPIFKDEISERLQMGAWTHLNKALTSTAKRMKEAKVE